MFQINGSMDESVLELENDHQSDDQSDAPQGSRPSQLPGSQGVASAAGSEPQECGRSDQKPEQGNDADDPNEAHSRLDYQNPMTLPRSCAGRRRSWHRRDGPATDDL